MKASGRFGILYTSHHKGAGYRCDEPALPASAGVSDADMRVKLHLVFNPASGQFRQERLEALTAALEAQGFDPVLVPSRIDGLMIPSEARLVCVFGGDGTLRLVAQALGDRIGDVALCVCPSGTINLVARELGYAADPGTFAARLAKAWARGPAAWVVSPLVETGTTPVVSCLSIGPDSLAVAGVSGALKARIGRLAYAVAGLKLLWRWPRAVLRIRAETPAGGVLVLDAEAMFVARGRYYAGPFRLSRAARLGSAGFELVTLPSASRMRCAAFMLALALGLRPERLGLARVQTVRTLTIDPGTMPVQVDGDTVSAAGPIHIGMAGRAARFCV